MSQSNTQHETDLHHLRRCFVLASEARVAGQHPFGSLIVDENGEVLVEARNHVRPPDGDPTRHAELAAVSRAGKLFPPERLARATLYTSTEPCCMCAGAIYWANIGRVVYGLSEEGLYKMTGANEENPTLSLPCREVFGAASEKWKSSGPFWKRKPPNRTKGFGVRVPEDRSFRACASFRRVRAIHLPRNPRGGARWLAPASKKHRSCNGAE